MTFDIKSKTFRRSPSAADASDFFVSCDKKVTKKSRCKPLGFPDFNWIEVEFVQNLRYCFPEVWVPSDWFQWLECKTAFLLVTHRRYDLVLVLVLTFEVDFEFDLNEPWPCRGAQAWAEEALKTV